MLATTGLYTIEQFEYHEDIITATISLDATHQIFKGHFPEQPILPGVCMLQLSQELIEHALDTKILMHTTGQIKFLKPIQPETDKVLQISIRLTANLEKVVIVWKNASDNITLKYTADYKIL